MPGDDGVAGASYRFLPVVRRGFRPDEAFKADRSSQPITGPPAFGVDLAVSARRMDDDSWDRQPDPIGTDDGITQPSQRIRMYGPGDVVGIDREQVVRVEPEPNTGSFPPNLFPLIEFERADLPWLFSPERADDRDGRARNRPWLTLVVVEKRADGVSVTGDGPGDLPVLEAPPAELPPIGEVWAWAHAQIVGDDAPATDVLGSEPSRAVSRLVCPRNLDPDTEYVAAVVPTFKPGRLAGLGRDPHPSGSGSDSSSSSENGDGGDSDSSGDQAGSREIELAWSPDAEEPVRLPVYYMWEFTSGTADFEKLVDRLDQVRLGDSNVGRRKVDVSRPGPDEVASVDPIHQTGALGSPGLEVDELDGQRRSDLTALLNRPDKLSDGDQQPVVGAPLYGQWHADRDRIGSGPAWFDELNRHLRYRIAAGLGAEVIRDKQEEYVARAWDQVGQLEEVNRVLREGQLARAASNRTYARLEATVGPTGEANPARLLQFTRPVHDRLPAADRGTDDVLRSFRAKFEQRADFPEAVTSPAYRRLGRPKGPLLRNADLERVTPDPVTPTTIAEDVAAGRITPRDLKKELRPRITTLDDLSGDEWRKQHPAEAADGSAFQHVRSLSGSGPRRSTEGTDGSTWQTTSGTVPEGTGLDAPAMGTMTESLPGDGTPPSRAAGEGSATSVGVALPGDSSFAPVELPAGLDEPVPAEFANGHRLGTWAGSLPELDLTRLDLGTVPPTQPNAFAVRTVDTQLRSAIDHCRTALDRVEELSRRFPEPGDASEEPAGDGPPADEGPGTVGESEDVYEDGGPPEEFGPDRAGPADDGVSVAEVRDVTRDVGVNTFQALNRTLDNLLSTQPESAPARVTRDKVGFVQGLIEDHDAAVGALDDLVEELRGAGIDPNTGWGGEEPPLGGDRERGGVDPNTGDDVFGRGNEWIDEAAVHMQRVLERLGRSRLGIAGPDRYRPPGGDGFGPDRVGPPLWGGEAASFMELLDPEKTIPETVLARIDAGDDGLGGGLAARADPIEPVLWAPSLPDPMSEQLVRLSDDYLMPGVDDVPRNSVGALATNPEVVEAFLAGANHEFARELLWRRFPTDRRGTYFDTFWDKVANPLSTADDRPDVAELHTWSADLGENSPDSERPGADPPEGNGRVVLVIRGELLRRHPDTTIYMVESKPDETGADRAGRSPKLNVVGEVTPERVRNDPTLRETVKFPIFKGRVDPDVTYLGFELSPGDAVGDPDADDPGWFFVFEEPMGETKFGLDHGEGGDVGSVPPGIVTGDASTSLSDADATDVIREIHRLDDVEGGEVEVAWNGLSWHHLLSEQADVDEQLTYLRLSGTPPGENDWRVPEKLDPQRSSLSVPQEYRDDYDELSNAFAEWGRNSAHMARITWQRPVRVAIHADDLLSAEVGEEDGDQ